MARRPAAGRRRPGLVALVSDFGAADGYPAQMKGAILSLNPAARLVDVSHEVPPGDVRRAALLLEDARPFFPPACVWVLVVDPGVGGPRRLLAARAARGDWFLAPDNGLLEPVLAEDPPPALRELANSALFPVPAAATFHGRDLLAPAAARLTLGLAAEELGPPAAGPRRLALPRARAVAGGLAGVVLYADRFGNLVTSLRREDLERPGWDAASCRVELAGVAVGALRRCYAEAEPGALLALFNSAGRLEIAAREGRAAGRRPQFKVGARVVLRRHCPLPTAR